MIVDRANVRFPPPFVFVGFILLGMLVDRLLRLAPFPAEGPLRWLGAVPLLAGVAVLVAAQGPFRATGQHPAPWKPSPTFIDTGLYRFTRNPMYMAMAMIQLGIGWLFASLGALLALPVSIMAIDRFVIASEEAYLHIKFGATYDDYRRRVRRWI